MAYEIHINYWLHNTDILTAKATLYIIGDWVISDGVVTERECLLHEQPVFECINTAIKDNEENNKED